MDIKQLSSKIKLIKTNGAKLDALIQEAALGCIEHAAEHGDVRPANQLWEAMPNGSRRNALGMYLCQYGAMRVNTGKDKEQARFKFKKDFETDVTAARATSVSKSFWNLNRACSLSLPVLTRIAPYCTKYMPRALRLEPLGIASHNWLAGRTSPCAAACSMQPSAAS